MLIEVPQRNYAERIQVVIEQNVNVVTNLSLEARIAETN